MLKLFWYLDVYLRFYCFILRAEFEIITKRKPGTQWTRIYSIINDKDKNLRTVLYTFYLIHKRRFIKNTIEWLDYFTALYDQKCLNANPESSN